MSQTKREHSSGTRGGADGEVLRAQLTVKPALDVGCYLLAADATIEEVRHNFKLDLSACGSDPSWDCLADCGECHVKIETSDDTNAGQYTTSPVKPNCVCPVFERHDIIYHLETAKDGTLTFRVVVPSRDSFREIVSALRANGASVSIDWLITDKEGRTVAEVDTSSITEKQERALEVALESGYYDTPRQSDLSDVADKLDISSSATSQRLNAGETKLVKAFLEG